MIEVYVKLIINKRRSFDKIPEELKETVEFRLAELGYDTNGDLVKFQVKGNIDMDEKYLTLELHNEYAKRMHEEDERQNHRLAKLEKAVDENVKLALSIERLTISVQSMVKEQKVQGQRLETLENRDGESWRKAIGYLVTTIIGIVVGYIFKHLGM